MISRTIYRRRAGRRFLAVIATASILGGLVASSAPVLAVHEVGTFELEGDTLNDLTSSAIGTLGQNITAGATQIKVCQTAPLTATTVPFTIIIDAETMQVTATATTTLGGCSALKRLYTVTRAFNGPLPSAFDGPAASHSGGADVTKLEPGVTPDSTGLRAGDDWSNIWEGCRDPDDATEPGTGEGADFDGCTFVNDKIGTDSDATYFTGGGSKDREDLSQWQFSVNDQSPDKNDIVNAFAAAYSPGTDRLLYFGGDRYQVGGDAQMGFWFLVDAVCLAGQTLPDGNVCPNDNPGKFVDPDTGAIASHSQGDLLALVNYNNGGSIGLAGVYEWDEAAGEPVQVLFGTGADCTTIGGGDDFCTVSNKTLHRFEPPWGSLYKGKLGGTDVNYYQTSAFLEGGIDLGAIPGSATCFSTFLAETRSSSGPDTGLSLDAQLKDLSFGQFQQCETSIATTPADGSGNVLVDGTDVEDTLPEAQLGTGAAGVLVKDLATLTVTGLSEWDGTIAFSICGPIADPATCTTNGASGGSVNVDETTVFPVASSAVKLTEVGRYCWRGTFTPSAQSAEDGLKSATDSSLGECFEVLPVTPILTTTAVEPFTGFAPTIVGSKADLNGSATVDAADDSNAFYGDTSIIDGQLDCNAWGATANDGTAGDGVIDGSDDCTLIGVDGTADGVIIVVVNGQFATADAVAIPNGTKLPVVFNAGDPDNADIGDSDFAWSALFGRVDANGDETIDGDDCHVGIIGTANILGENCGFSPATPAWLNGYVDINGDSQITAADSCASCFFGRAVYNGLVKTGEVAFGDPMYDVATLLGTANQAATNGATATYPSILAANVASNGAPADGTISFTLVGPDACTPEIEDAAQQLTVSGDGYYRTAGFVAGAPGTYHWQAQYSGASADSPNTGDLPNTLGTAKHNAACDQPGESVTVSQIPTTVKTKQSWYPNDTATVAATQGNLPNGGTVDFYLFNNDDCTAGTNNANILYAERVSLGTSLGADEEVSTKNYPGGNGSAPSGFVWAAYAVTTAYTDTTSTTKPSASEKYSWKVVYTPGDDTHTGIQSACTEVFTITYTNDNGPGTDLP